MFFDQQFPSVVSNIMVNPDWAFAAPGLNPNLIVDTDDLTGVIQDATINLTGTVSD